jgi:hypothetical protein
MYYLTYVYGTYRTRLGAEVALDDMFAAGEVSESELVGIQKRGNRYCIVLRGA